MQSDGAELSLEVLIKAALKIANNLISFINSYSLRILKSFLIFGVLLFANSYLHAQTKIDLTKNVTDTAGKKGQHRN